MFADHMKKIDDAPQKTLLAIAAVLVIACQLVAMVVVVDGQVRKAELRDARYASQRLAVAQCIENSMGLARQSCLQQVQAAYNDNGDTLSNAGRPNQQAMADLAVLPPTPVNVPLSRGLMPASFVSR